MGGIIYDCLLSSNQIQFWAEPIWAKQGKRCGGGEFSTEKNEWVVHGSGRMLLCVRDRGVTESPVHTSLQRQFSNGFSSLSHDSNKGSLSAGVGTRYSHFLPTSRRIVQFSNQKVAIQSGHSAISFHKMWRTIDQQTHKKKIMMTSCIWRNVFANKAGRNLEHILMHQFGKLQGPGPEARIVYIDGAFDLFHAGHVEVGTQLLCLDCSIQQNVTQFFEAQDFHTTQIISLLCVRLAPISLYKRLLAILDIWVTIFITYMFALYQACASFLYKRKDCRLKLLKLKSAAF